MQIFLPTLRSLQLPLAAIAAFKALWPGKEVPKKVSQLCEWVRATQARLCEWRDSAGRMAIFKALQVVLSWYDGIDLADLRSIRSDSPYYTDEAAKKELEKKACELLDYADMHAQFFKDVNEPEESAKLMLAMMEKEPAARQWMNTQMSC